MTTVTKLDRATVARLAKQVIEDLVELEKAEGVTFTQGGGTLEADGLTAVIKIRVAIGGTDATLARAQQNWRQYAEVLFGLSVEHLGKTFDHAPGRPVKIIGLMPNRTKFPVYVQDGDKRVLLTAAEVIRKLGGMPRNAIDAETAAERRGLQSLAGRL